MKKTLLSLAAAVACFSASAQADNKKADCPTFYLGVSTGLENPAGLLAFNIEAPIKNFSVAGGAGLSSWGWKVFAEGRHYFSPCNRGWALGVGVSHNTGLNDFTTEMETIAGRRDVRVDLKPQTNVFLSGYHFFNLGRRNRFYIQGGYSIRLKEDVYSLEAGPMLDDDGETMMKILAPGGVILAVGFSFAI